MITKPAKREIDVHSFLSSLKQCTGRIYLETSNGDHYNLQSVFSRYILAALIHNGKLPEGTVYRFDEENASVLSPYIE